jgi:hypothetical protein
VRIPLTATLIALAVVLMPSAADAQRQPFVDHLIAFRSLLFGPYGDEGPGAVEELDRLSAALSAWDSSVRAEEGALRRGVMGPLPSLFAVAGLSTRCSRSTPHWRSIPGGARSIRSADVCSTRSDARPRRLARTSARGSSTGPTP